MDNISNLGISETMFKQLNAVLNALPKLLNKVELWDSLIINKRKPETYRVFTYIGSYRVCLHHFKAPDTEDTFWHPHAWPAAFAVLRGSYDLHLGRMLNRTSREVTGVNKFRMAAGSRYEMVNPMDGHKIVPITDTYTVMINGAPYSKNLVHPTVRTTKGKDLERMTPDELQAQLHKFKILWAGMKYDEAAFYD